MKIESISLHKIILTDNYRKVSNPAADDELTDSIREVGLLNPITVQKDGKNYRLVAGGRRVSAMLRLNHDKITAIVLTDENADADMIRLIENVQRTDPDPFDEAKYVWWLLRKTEGTTAAQVAKSIGKPLSWVNSRIMLYDLPAEVKYKYVAGEISKKNLRILAASPSHVVTTFLKTGVIHTARPKLKAASWDLSAENINSCGSCALCPKRSINLFTDEDDECYDLGCFNGKQAAQIAANKAAAPVAQPPADVPSQPRKTAKAKANEPANQDAPQDVAPLVDEPKPQSDLIIQAELRIAALKAELRQHEDKRSTSEKRMMEEDRHMMLEYLKDWKLSPTDMPVTKNELLDFVLHVTNEDNITLFNALLRFPSRLNYGHMRQLVRLTGPIGAAIYADQTVAMEALTKRFDQRAMEIEDAIKEAEQNLEQYQRQHSEALPPDAIDLPKLTKQNVSSILILKGRHPDTIILYRKDDAYIAIAEDSTVLHKVTKLPLKKSEKASVCGFHVDRLDKYLPMLIKAGHRVSVCDKLEEPKKVKESLNSQE